MWQFIAAGLNPMRQRKLDSHKKDAYDEEKTQLVKCVVACRWADCPGRVSEGEGYPQGAG